VLDADDAEVELVEVVVADEVLDAIVASEMTDTLPAKL